MRFQKLVSTHSVQEPTPRLPARAAERSDISSPPLLGVTSRNTHCPHYRNVNTEQKKKKGGKREDIAYMLVGAIGAK